MRITDLLDKRSITLDRNTRTEKSEALDQIVALMVKPVRRSRM